MYDSKCIGNVLQNAIPDAVAFVVGSEKYNDLKGVISFYDIGYAVLITTSLQGIPYRNGYCQHRILAIHIHEGGSCSGNSEDPFADAKSHYNPNNCPHPYHAGDLPPVFASDGIAWSAVVTSNFTIDEVMGRTVILHSKPDDFTTQPSGNAGEKIACGVIQPTARMPHIYGN